MGEEGGCKTRVSFKMNKGGNEGVRTVFLGVSIVVCRGEVWVFYDEVGVVIVRSSGMVRGMLGPRSSV